MGQMNISTTESMSATARLYPCGYGPCQCEVQLKDLYCSDYCRQAAAQGVERDYCQCNHERALSSADFPAMHALHLHTHFAPGMEEIRPA